MTLSRRRTPIVALIFSALAGLAPGCDRNNKAQAPQARSAQTATATRTVNQPKRSQVDERIHDAWSAASITPAPMVDNATFMRRTYLDLIGVVPSLEQARAFLSNESTTRRADLVDELLRSDAYAKHWTNYWDDVLMQGSRGRLVDRSAFRQWLVAQLRANVPYDEMVRRLLTASGVNSAGGRPDLAAWELEQEAPEGVNGAVNFMLTGTREPQNLAGTTSRVFLGVQIQCAQCHDHPTEKWKQTDFQRFTSAFMRVQGRPLERGMAMGKRRLSIDDAEQVTPRMRRRMNKTGYGELPPTALDGTSLDEAKPRQALARWLTAKDNPWFAQAIVNRMWAYFLGRGFVEPVDDMSTSNPPILPGLLNELTEDFVASGYDLRQLMRVVCNSTAYQRAPRGPAALWSSFALRPMNDTQLLDSLVLATGIAPIIEDVAGERLTRVRLNLRRRFRFTFDVDEDASADTFTGTTPQALMLLNGPLTAAGSSALDGSTLGDAARPAGDDTDVITQIYLATLSREPAPDELAHWRDYVANAAEQYPAGKPPARGGGAVGRIYRRKRLHDLRPEDVAYEDVFWALLNASEFFFIH